MLPYPGIIRHHCFHDSSNLVQQNEGKCEARLRLATLYRIGEGQGSICELELMLLHFSSDELMGRSITRDQALATFLRLNNVIASQRLF